MLELLGCHCCLALLGSQQRSLQKSFVCVGQQQKHTKKISRIAAVVVAKQMTNGLCTNLGWYS